MKKLLIFLSILSTIGWQELILSDNGGVIIEKESYPPRLYLINAYINKKRVGYISYHPIHNRKDAWKIDDFQVEVEYKNKGIGSQLFSAALHDLLSKNAKSVEWLAAPPMGSSHQYKASELIEIYKKLIKKLNLDYSRLTIGHIEDDYSAEMKLELIPPTPKTMTGTEK